MRGVSRKMKQSEELRRAVCFSLVPKEPWPIEQRHAGIHRPQKYCRFAPFLMGFGETTHVRLYLSVGNDKPHLKKKRKKRKIAHVQATPKLFLFRTCKQFASFI